MAKFQIQSIAIQELRKAGFTQTIIEEGDDFKDLDTKTFSTLGNPVYSNLVFDAKKYTWGDNELDFEGITINTVLFTINQQKNIVKTQVQGRNTTVKEYIADGDFSITAVGQIISPEPKVYPVKTNFGRTVVT